MSPEALQGLLGFSTGHGAAASGSVMPSFECQAPVRVLEPVPLSGDATPGLDPGPQADFCPFLCSEGRGAGLCPVTGQGES